MCVRVKMKRVSLKNSKDFPKEILKIIEQANYSNEELVLCSYSAETPTKSFKDSKEPQEESQKESFVIGLWGSVRTKPIRVGAVIGPERNLSNLGFTFSSGEYWTLTNQTSSVRNELASCPFSPFSRHFSAIIAVARLQVVVLVAITTLHQSYI